MPEEVQTIEHEAIILKAVKELIDEMVCFELMSLEGSDPDSNIVFKSITHQRFFNVVLVDFLSLTDKKGPVEQTSYLSGLKSISADPKFDVNGSVAALKQATSEFTNWLEQMVEVDTWLPSIEKQVKLKIARFSFLRMTGNISKHNYLRSARIAEELKNILDNNGIAVDTDGALLALSDFYERFHTDILNYHASTIAEFLNNIRWGIFEYLQPELQRSIEHEDGDPQKYRYTYPEGMNSEFAKASYWDLMNEVRRMPYMRRFTVTKSLKLRY